ncbi:MAG: biosynthetic arginine decarboxylase [Rhodobacteraceae bacterium]|nr:biosynthetic arginine decarboxylase [Paracoccaceae bacterium]
MPKPANAPHSIYGIDKWGKDLIVVLDNGDVGLRNPLCPEAPAASLPAILRDLDDRGVQVPMILRIASYLQHEIRHINGCFQNAIARAGYKGCYRGVFPIKVNQQAQVVDRIVEFGRPFDYGLEAGSKPELVMALAHRLPSGALLICNGVKDVEFLRLAILSRKLGFNTFIVLESPKEADKVIEVARDLGIEPALGVRVKLTHRISGKWESSSGDRSAFGMSSEQLIEVVDKLRQAGLLHCLQLQHAHLGSQVPDINSVRTALGEVCRYYTALRHEGVPLTHLDLGGGLGIDYTGEQRASESSINYTVQEYCTNVVETIQYAMDDAQMPHPTLITESGRAVVATSSLLVFNVLGATLYDAPKGPAPPPAQKTDHHLVSDLNAVNDYLCPTRLQECWNDAFYYRNELRTLFQRGAIDLRQMARAERIYLHLMARIKALAETADAPSDVAQQLQSFADIYHCNFSLFQSLPDVWAIGQLHPIVPLQNLHCSADRRAVLSDITCDSDGRIERFILANGVAQSLPVHTLEEDTPYYLGAFFVGAYQETLGDLHNLFGDTNVVTIDLRADGGFDLLHEQEGDTIAQVLSYMEFDPVDCLAAFRRMVDEAISSGTLMARDRKTLIQAYRESINGYTYYE